MPSVSRETAILEDHGPVVDRHQDVGDSTIQFITFNVDTDGTALLKGLPGDQCTCEHWGYVFRGRVTFRFPGGEETFGPGDAFYVGPGHVPVIAAGTEYLQFSPAEKLRVLSETILRNARELQMIQARP